MDDLERAVEMVVGRCLGVAAGEGVVVVADTTTRRTGNVLREAAARAGAPRADEANFTPYGHFDCVVLSPTLDVVGSRVLETGEFLLDS